MGSVTVQRYLELNSNQKYGCSKCEFCGEVACYISVSDAELGHECDEHNLAWTNASTFNAIKNTELLEILENG